MKDAGRQNDSVIGDVQTPKNKTGSGDQIPANTRVGVKGKNEPVLVRDYNNIT